MCLAIVALDALPDWPLVIVANRDEFHAREASEAAPWHDAPDVVAGRDLQAGGTWLGVTRQGRAALLTNYREPGLRNPLAPSRGRLVENYLRGDTTADEYAQAIAARTQEHNGFSLLLADEAGVWYASNRSDATGSRLPSGIVGLSNALLDTPWPKLVRSREAVGRHLGTQPTPDVDTLISIFRDSVPPPDHELPDTGLGVERERRLACPFILDPQYGTRCTSVILRHARGHTLFYEQNYATDGTPTGRNAWRVDPNAGIARIPVGQPLAAMPF
ncbi:MAG: NRDE family protein [Burkholderiales bacterium]